MTILEFWKKNKGLIVFAFLLFTFRSVFADWNLVPSGSMKPTLLEGDRILVNRMAYDIRVPFTHLSLVKLADPSRGDIVVFDSNVADKRLVKRVVGIPGDTVEMRNNRLFVNGEMAHYEPLANTNENDFIEAVAGNKRSIRTNSIGGRVSSFAPVVVPNDQYLVLGDNRDNSADSRFIGFVPRAEILGRTQTVILSLNSENYYLPREDRIFQAL